MDTPIIPFSSLPVPSGFLEAAVPATCVPRLDINAMGSSTGLVWSLPPEGVCRSSGDGYASCSSLRAISTISWNRPGAPVGTPPEIYLPDTVNPSIKGFLASSIRASTGGTVGSPMVMSGTSFLSLVDENNAPLKYIVWSLASANRCPLSTPLLDNAPLVQIANNEEVITYIDSTPAGRCSNAAVSGRTVSRCSSTGVPDFLVGNVLLDNFTNSYDSCLNACDVGTSPGVGSLGSDGRYYLSAGSSATFYPEFAPNCATAGVSRTCTGFNSADGTVDTLGSLTGSATLTRTSLGSCTSRCPAAAAISWSASGNTCTFTTAAAAEHGYSTGIVSTNANTGAATLSCDRDLGWQVSGGTCAPPYIWTYNRWLGYTYADSAHEEVENATTDSPCSAVSSPSGPYDPSISGYYDCSGGCAVLNSTRTTSVGASCFRGGTYITALRSNAECICTNAPAGNCAAGNRTWGAGCSANFPLTPAGGVTASIANTVSGYTGSGAFRCDAGVWSATPQVGSNCDVIPSTCTTFNSVVQPPFDPFANGNNGGTLITIPTTGEYTISVNYLSSWDDASYSQGNSCERGLARVVRVSDGAVLDEFSAGGPAFVAAEPQCQTGANSVSRSGTLRWTSNAGDQVRIYLSWNYGSAAPTVNASWGWGKVTTSGATCPAAAVPMCWSMDEADAVSYDPARCSAGNVGSCTVAGEWKSGGKCAERATGNFEYVGGSIAHNHSECRPVSEGRCNGVGVPPPTCQNSGVVPITTFVPQTAGGCSNYCSAQMPGCMMTGSDFDLGGGNASCDCALAAPGFGWNTGSTDDSGGICSGTLPSCTPPDNGFGAWTNGITNTRAGYTGSTDARCFDSDPVVGNIAKEWVLRNAICNVSTCTYSWMTPIIPERIANTGYSSAGCSDPSGGVPTAACNAGSWGTSKVCPDGPGDAFLFRCQRSGTCP